MDALARARYITFYYRDLQGYRLLPFAVFFTIVAVLRLLLDSPAAPEAWMDINASYRLLALQGGSLTLLIAAAITSNQIGRRYEERYGTVRAARGMPHAFSRSSWFLCALLWILGGYSWITLLGYWQIGATAYTALRTGLLRHGAMCRVSAPVPLAVLYVLIGVVFVGSGTSLVGPHSIGTEFGPNLYHVVYRSLAAAAFLAVVAVYNHRLLTSVYGVPELAEEA